MTINIPSIHAVIPMIPQILPHTQKLYQGDEKTGLINVDALFALANATKNVHLRRFDDPDKPFVKRDAAGNETVIMMWGHPKNSLDSDYIIAFLCKKTTDGSYKPETVIRGSKANVLIVGGMSCCGSSVQAHWTQVMGNGTVIDSAHVPLEGLPHPEHANWLKGKMHLADTINDPAAKQALYHMAMDVLSARYPNEQQFKHACADNSNYMDFAKSGQTLTLG